MFLKKILALFSVISVVVICESAFVDTLYKCSKDDGECQKKLITDVLQKLGEHGDSELGIPAIDPLVLHNEKFSILDVEILLDGLIKGIKKCALNNFTPNVDKGVAKLDLTCDAVVVKGKYKISSKSPLIKNLLGGDVRGEGDGKVKITKLSLRIEIPFVVVKKGDDLFLSGNREKLTYTFDIHGKVTFAANNLYVGEKESSATIIKIMNDSSEILVQSFGKIVMDIAMDYIFNFTNKFFTSVPTKHYFMEDLTPYVEN